MDESLGLDTQIVLQLNHADSVSEVIDIAYKNLSQNPSGEAIIKRLQNIIDIAKGDGIDLSVNSLKGMILFLSTAPYIRKPAITVDDDGIFYTSWRKTLKEKVIVSFENEQILNYVIFQPSQYTDNRVVLDGTANILDFHNTTVIKWEEW